MHQMFQSLSSICHARAKWLVPLLLMGFLAGCGQKGPLYLPLAALANVHHFHLFIS
jgi:predicted small lipoprotein YifL